jgi:hypothetical protein
LAIIRAFAAFCGEGRDMNDRFNDLYREPAKLIGVRPMKPLRLEKSLCAASAETGQGRAAAARAALLRASESHQCTLLEQFDPTGALEGMTACVRRSGIASCDNQFSFILDVGAATGRAGRSSESSLRDERSSKAGRGAG